MIPPIRTTRLQLTSFSHLHFDRFCEMHNDPEVMRYIADGKPQSREDAWRTMAVFLGHWQLRGFGIWAVEDLHTRLLLGWVGFYFPDQREVIDFGWRFLRSAWGQGYATESAQAALEYATKHWRLSNVASVIHQQNMPSARVAKKLGGQQTKTIDFFGSPNDLYRYPQF